jgi:acetamidase/formamidase
VAEYFLDNSTTHAFWDNSFPPRLEINSGDTVTFDCRESFDGQVTPDSGVEVWNTVDFSRVHSLLGPVFVRGAKPGDTLEVEILDFAHKGWGWTGWFPGAGLLSEEFNYPFLQHWRLEGKNCYFQENDLVTIPFEPCCGVMGVAPKENGRFTTLPPRANGGNVNIRQLTTGARALFPVFTEGAGFATGDGHAAQGDGEVCCTAIEAPLIITLRFHVRTDLSVPEQHLLSPSPLQEKGTQGHYCTTGHGEDIYLCVQNAVRHMIDYLEATYGISRNQAYCLCSVAGDLKISQVAMQNRVVSFCIPKNIFTIQESQ